MYKFFPYLLIFCAFGTQIVRAQPSPTKTTNEKAATYFEKDPRLEIVFPIALGKYKHETLSSRLKRATGVPIAIQDPEIRLGTSFIAAKNPSARGVLEALAAANNGRWERTPKEGYNLLGSTDEIDAVFGFHTETGRLRNEAGNQMLQNLKYLSPEQSQKLSLPPEGQRGLAFTDMPENIRNNIRKMVEAINEEDADKGDVPISEADLQEARINLIEKNHTASLGFQSFWFSINSKKLSYGWRINTYSASKARQEKVENDRIENGLLGNIYMPSKSMLPVTMQKTVLKKLVSLRIVRGTAKDALKQLHEQTDIPMMCVTSTMATGRINLRLDRVALSTALEKLVESLSQVNQKHSIKWLYTKNGFVVVSQSLDFTQLKPTTVKTAPKPTTND